MSRTELLATVNKVVSSNLQPAAGISVLVQARGTGTTVPVYAAETGGTTVSNPLVTDANGRINGWVDSGSYNLTISGSGVTTYTQPYESVRGDGVDLIAVNAIDTPQLKNASVTAAKLAADVVGSIIPTGTILPYGGTSAPAGWVLADGTTYNGTLTQYQALWTVYGTRFGGTGQASFKVPDGRGRFLVGMDAGSGRGAIYNIGDVGGAERVGLTAAQNGPHFHAQQGVIGTNQTGSHSHGGASGGSTIDLSHGHGLGNGGAVATTGNVYVSGAAKADWFGWYAVFDTGDASKITGTVGGGTPDHGHYISEDGAHSHIAVLSGNTATDGTGAQHENRPPYITVNWIVKL